MRDVVAKEVQVHLIPTSTKPYCMTDFQSVVPLTILSSCDRLLVNKQFLECKSHALSLESGGQKKKSRSSNNPSASCDFANLWVLSTMMVAFPLGLGSLERLPNLMRRGASYESERELVGSGRWDRVAGVWDLHVNQP